MIQVRKMTWCRVELSVWTCWKPSSRQDILTKRERQGLVYVTIYVNRLTELLEAKSSLHVLDNEVAAFVSAVRHGDIDP